MDVYVPALAGGHTEGILVGTLAQAVFSECRAQGKITAYSSYIFLGTYLWLRKSFEKCQQATLYHNVQYTNT